MLQAPGGNITDLFPGGAKGLGGFLPGELACPVGQKEHIGLGQLVLAIGPRHLFNHRAAGAAVDAPHAVEEENQEAPERDELKAPLGKVIVTWRGFLAAGADRGGTLAGPNGNLNGPLVGTEASMLVDESPERVAVV